MSEQAEINAMEHEVKKYKEAMRALIDDNHELRETIEDLKRENRRLIEIISKLDSSDHLPNTGKKVKHEQT